MPGRSNKNCTSKAGVGVAPGVDFGQAEEWAERFIDCQEITASDPYRRGTRGREAICQDPLRRSQRPGLGSLHHDRSSTSPPIHNSGIGDCEGGETERPGYRCMILAAGDGYRRQTSPGQGKGTPPGVDFGQMGKRAVRFSHASGEGCRKPRSRCFQTLPIDQRSRAQRRAWTLGKRAGGRSGSAANRSACRLRLAKHRPHPAGPKHDLDLSILRVVLDTFDQEVEDP
jgi:hypothetical protein